MCGAVSDIEACIPGLRRHATALLRDPRDVDNLVRDCLFRTLEQTRASSDQTDIRTWLFGIMYGQLASRTWRARLRRATRPAAKEGQDALRALDYLADQQRAVLLLVAVEDLSYADVAHILGISMAAVMSSLADGRESLRRLGTQAADAGQRRMG
jgi:RNA polymerase sigma-70 factor (ECF subfamily)